METCWEHNQNMGCHKKLIPQTLKVLLMALRPGLEYLHNDSRNYYFLADSTRQTFFHVVV